MNAGNTTSRPAHITAPRRDVQCGGPVKSRPGVRPASQRRSKISFERTLDAGLALLVERRSDAFTLGEVAQRAGVSIGAIYGRVDSKDDLLRTICEREMSRLRSEQRRDFGGAAVEGVSLDATVQWLVNTLAEFLRRNAGVLAPFMMLAGRDAAVAELGKAEHEDMVGAFREVLLSCRQLIGHPDPDRAVTWSCTVAYSVLARWLGLGSSVEAAGEGEWRRIVADLADMITAFLVATPAGRSA